MIEVLCTIYLLIQSKYIQATLIKYNLCEEKQLYLVKKNIICLLTITFEKPL